MTTVRYQKQYEQVECQEWFVEDDDRFQRLENHVFHCWDKATVYEGIPAPIAGCPHYLSWQFENEQLVGTWFLDGKWHCTAIKQE